MPVDPGTVVRSFFEPMQARDWTGPGELLARGRRNARQLRSLVGGASGHLTAS
jgi:hypothetical protein